MNSKEIIASGMIESYVLGTASAEEIALVNKMAVQYAEVEEEIKAVEEAVLAFASASAPDLGKVKNRLFEEINREGKIIPIAPAPVKNKPLIKLIAAAASLLLVVSVILNFILYTKLGKTAAELASINSDKHTLAAQLKIQQVAFNNISEQLAVSTNPANRPVQLKGQEIAPASLAMVYWNSSSAEVYLKVGELPQAPSDKQYQLWAIVNGKPIDAGLVDLSTDSLQKMKRVEGAQAFAITLEKKGGSDVPTLTALYLLGNV